MQTTRINGFQQFSTTGPVSFNSQLITNVQNPVNPQDAATKAYVDSVAVGLNVKDAVRVATTANITLSGTQTIDGIALSSGDRVLVKNQSTQTQNGIYVVAVGSWARSQDADTNTEVRAGLFVFVSEGTTLGDTGWVLTTDNPINLGVTALTFAQFSGAGTYLAGNGLSLTGSTFAVVGTTGRIVVSGSGVDLAPIAGVQGTYGNTGYSVPNITVDGYGRISAAAPRDLFDTKAANYVFAGPASGVDQAPTFRFLVFADVIDALYPAGSPATQPTNGQLLIGNGATFTLSTLTQGATGISITNASGSITINNTGVITITGTTNQITPTTATAGAVTLAFPTTGVTLPQKTTLTAAATTYASLNVPTGTAPTSPNVGDIWLVQATGIWARYGSTPATYNLADLSSDQTFTNKTLSNPTLASISADAQEATGLLVNAANKIVTREFGTNAFNSTAYVTSVAGTAARITVTGTTAVTVDIASTYAGQTSINTLGTIGTGTWQGSTVGVAYGGTGQTSYTNGQLLIGNTTGNTLTKATLTAGNNINIALGAGSITISTPDSIQIGKYIVRSALTGTVNGVNTAFTLAHTPVAGTEMIFVNGLLQQPGAGNDYSISGASVTFLTGSIPQTGDILLATYIAS